MHTSHMNTLVAEPRGERCPGVCLCSIHDLIVPSTVRQAQRRTHASNRCATVWSPEPNLSCPGAQLLALRIKRLAHLGSQSDDIAALNMLATRGCVQARGTGTSVGAQACMQRRTATMKGRCADVCLIRDYCYFHFTQNWLLAH